MSKEMMKAESPIFADLLTRVLIRNQKRWLRFVQSMIGDQFDAEDVLQEAVRRVLSRDKPFQSEEQVRMYLGRTIANTAIEHYHARRRERTRYLPLQEQILPASRRGASPQEWLEELENARETERIVRLIHLGLNTLPQKQREALRLTLLTSDGSSIREAGQESGIPYSTLRHRSVQGIRRLRRYIHRAIRQGTQSFIFA